ncbi:MAG: LysM peptidoglycan-binding domain-containing protein [Candidatus Cryptobacteroides sp.]
MRIQIFTFSALIASCLLGVQTNTAAQTYTQEPVTISSERVRAEDGKIYYCHKVLDHQTLYSVAKAYGVSIDDICKANPKEDLKTQGLKKDSIIYVPYVKEASGKNDIVKEEKAVADPPRKEETKTEPAPRQTVQTETKKAKKGEDYFIHVSRWYEDIDDIAYKYSIPVNVLMEYNGLTSHKLKNRQKIKVPVDCKTAVPRKDAQENIENVKQEEQKEESSQETVKEEEKESIDEPVGREDRKVSALLMLPLKATASEPNENSFDFYCGALLAVDRLKEQGVDIDLSVYDVSTSLPITAERLAASDLAIGPVSRTQLERVLELAPESTAIISPLDPRTADLAETHRNMFQAPATQREQYADLLDWIKSERKAADKVFVISEKGVAGTSGMQMMSELIESSGMNPSYYSYNILQGREAVNSLEGMMTKSGVNRVIINSESEAFVNDAVRNLATLVYRKNNVVLYSPSKIRSFDTIDAENLHNLNTRISTSYYVDYNSRETTDFLMKYRALYNAEPTQFAFQGYDLTYYFISQKAKFGRNWVKRIEICPAANMIQTDFRFRREDGNGFTNKAVRRIEYKPDYIVNIVD